MEVAELKQYITDNSLECIPKILESLGCENIKVNQNYITASNPDGDNSSAITVYVNEWGIRVINWTRGYDNGDIINMVEDMMGTGFSDAFKWLHQTLGLKHTAKRPEKPKPEVEDPFKRLRAFKDSTKKRNEVNPIEESELLKFSNIEWEGLYREGIMPWTCKEFGVRYSYKWKRIIYPHRYAVDGRLLAYNARTVIDNYEELGISKFYLTKGYLKSSNIYGLWENRPYIEREGCCIVVESEKSVLKRHSLKDRRFCAVSGHTISEEQKRILAALDVKEIIIAFDNDVPLRDVLLACEKLYPFKPISFIRDPEGILGPKDSIADLPNEKCNYLIENRTKYTSLVREAFMQKERARGA